MCLNGWSTDVSVSMYDDDGTGTEGVLFESMHLNCQETKISGI